MRITVFLVLAPIVALAQDSPAPGRAGGGWGADAPYQRHFDTTRVETIEGEVVAIERVVPLEGMSAGVHLTLKSGEKTRSVHLGPEWFLQRQELALHIGDEIEVLGAWMHAREDPPMIAVEVRRGDEVLVLRDREGFPVWSAWRRGARERDGVWRGSRGWGARGRYGRLYDPKKTVQIDGTILVVERFVPIRGMGAGIRLRLETEDGEQIVHLGPEWYVAHQDLKLERGAKVRVTGSKAEPKKGALVVIAATVEHEDQILRLRDEKGMPYWNACRGRRPARASGPASG